MYCEKLKPMPANSALNSRLQILDQVVLVVTGGPFVERLQRHEEFRVEEARRVAAVVRPAMLRDDRDDLGVAQQDFAHLGHVRHRRFQRDRRRHRARIHRLPSSSAGRNSLPSERAMNPVPTRNATPADRDQLAIVQSPAQHGCIDMVQKANDDRFGLRHVPAADRTSAPA